MCPVTNNAKVIPARAGVIPVVVDEAKNNISYSRASGGDPKMPNINENFVKLFPRERG